MKKGQILGDTVHVPLLHHKNIDFQRLHTLQEL